MAAPALMAFELNSATTVGTDLRVGPGSEDPPLSSAEVGVIDHHPMLDPVLHRCEEHRLWQSRFSLRSTRPCEMHDGDNLRFIDAHEQDVIAVMAHGYRSHVAAVEWMVAPHLRRKLRLESQRVRSDSAPRSLIFHG